MGDYNRGADLVTQFGELARRIAALERTQPLITSEAPTQLRIVRGLVASAGTTREGEGFTVTRNSTGNYTVTFDPAFADAPATTFTPALAGGTETVPRLLADGSATAVTVLFVRRSDGTVFDTDFHFIAIGPA